MTLTEQDHRAADAKILLDNPIFKEAFLHVRERLIESIEDCPLDDEKLREKLMISLQALRSVKLQIEGVIEDGLIQNIKQENF